LDGKFGVKNKKERGEMWWVIRRGKKWNRVKMGENLDFSYKESKNFKMQCRDK